MTRYKATQISSVGVAFDGDVPDLDDDQDAQDVDREATLIIQHSDGMTDEIDVGPVGASVLHQMVSYEQYEVESP
jgi:hypothetical protein